MTLRSKPCPPRLDLDALVKRAQANFDAFTPSQKLRHRYMQRRSWAYSCCTTRACHDYLGQRWPHEAVLTDTQIGLILVGEKY
jgi:hypothetical protein